jgi:hypothetical protein
LGIDVVVICSASVGVGVGCGVGVGVGVLVGVGVGVLVGRGVDVGRGLERSSRWIPNVPEDPGRADPAITVAVLRAINAAIASALRSIRRWFITRPPRGRADRRVT